MRKSYPSDITKEQFGIVRGDPEKSKKKTRPQTYDLYDIFCALLYLLKECSLVMSLGYDFFIFFISIFSIIAPILDNEKILHKLLFNMAKFSNFVTHH